MEILFQCRAATLEDLPQIMKVAISSYGIYKDALDADNWSTLERFLTNEKAFSELIQHSHPFVSVIDKKVIGMAFLVPAGNPTEIYPADWCYIRMVGVDPEFKGRGNARALTMMCIEQARINNESVIALHTSEFMHAARHLYESIGFQMLREIPQRLGKRYWLYTLNLTNTKTEPE